jgi:hypothetical protein
VCGPVGAAVSDRIDCYLRDFEKGVHGAVPEIIDRRLNAVNAFREDAALATSNGCQRRSPWIVR